jgi:sarcosine oxidase subunit beta
VTGIRSEAGRLVGLETDKGPIATETAALVVAGHSSVLARRAGFALPIASYPLQALVSEPLKPCFPCVAMSGTIHAYVSQSDKGELVIGAGTDRYPSYGQKGSPPVIEDALEAVCELLPRFRRVRMLRQWAGIVDVTPDRSPIIGESPIRGLWLNCGWGTGGFKATPGSGHLFAWSLAHDRPHPIVAPFGLERFAAGRLVDEAAAAAVEH